MTPVYGSKGNRGNFALAIIALATGDQRLWELAIDGLPEWMVDAMLEEYENLKGDKGNSQDRG